MTRSRSASLLIAALLVLCSIVLPGCSSSAVREPFAVPDELTQEGDGSVAENMNYTLEHDTVTGCVSLHSRSGTQVWSTTPYAFWQSGDYNIDLLSALTIEYYDPTDASRQVAYASDCVDMLSFSSATEKNGLCQTYWFSEQEIALTVHYTLLDDRLRISFSGSDIVESGKTKLLNVSLAPYLCSTENSTEHDRYLFVPAGSGALMYTDPSPGSARSYSGEVYGSDPSHFILDDPGEEEAVRLPVFGVRSGDTGLCGIITDSPGSAKICATAGSTQDGYSTVYASFSVRGYVDIEWDTGVERNGTELYQDALLLEDAPQSNRVFAVEYVPLSGEKASYSGMADTYRQYLRDNGLLTNSEQVQKPYHLTILGGAEEKRFLFGIPYRSLLALTTADEAGQIVQELTDATGQAPQVLLKGFGRSGVDIGRLAGGFSLAGKLVGKDGLQTLETLCRTQSALLFTDFDLVQLSRSGNGFSTLFGTASAANTERVVRYPLRPNVRTEDTDSPASYLLRRSLLSKAIDKLTDATEGRLSGIGLTTVGSMAYSDYTDPAYGLKSGYQAQISDAVDTLHKAGHPVLFGAANDYAAGLADSLYDTPLHNGNYRAFDLTVPFYAMVYRGSIPLYSEPIDLATDAEDLLLRAVEVGVSPAFTVSYTLDTALADATQSYWYGVLYSSEKDTIVQTVEQTKELYAALGDASVVSHRTIQTGLTETVFSNGIVVLVNKTEQDLSAGGEMVQARSFTYRKEATP